MDMNHEEAFAEEAQEEALGQETMQQEISTQSKSHVRISEEYLDGQTETSPLVGSRGQRETLDRGFSYQRAISEPWTGAHGSGNIPWYKKPSMYWLLPAFFPFCIAFGGIIVPKTYLIQDLICRDLYSDRSLKDPNFTFAPIVIGGQNDQCGEDNEVQARTAMFNLYMNLLSGLFSALVAPHFGALSDRVGRRPVIVCATFGAFLGEVITITVGTNPDKFSVYWILVGSLADGLCGSFTTSMALCFAYASDCTAPERRNVAFGHFHATLFAGVAIGPIFAGFLMKVTNTIMAPFYFALACHLFFISFTALVVPESLSKERKMIAREKYQAATAGQSWRARWSKSYNIFAPLWVLWPTGPGSSKKLRRNLSVLASIDTMMFGVAMGTLQIIILYGRKRFHWDPVQSSGFLSAVNICRVTGLIVILPALTRWVRGPVTGQSSGHRGADMLDINIIRIAVLFDLIGYLGYAITPSGGLMVLAGMIASLGGIGSPTLQSSMTKHIPADRTGQVLGASGLLHALARVVAPIIFNLIYSRTVATYAGVVFICLASVFVITFILSWFLKPGIYLDEKTVEGDSNTHEREPLTG